MSDEKNIKVKEFIIDIVEGPVKQVSGMVEDWLKYYRYKNLIVVTEKVKQIQRKREFEGKQVPLKPKFMLEILQSSSIEDEGELQDVWARLIANSIDPNFFEKQHPAFIEIIKQISVDEVVILAEFNRLEREAIIINSESHSIGAGYVESTNTSKVSEKLLGKYSLLIEDLPIKNMDYAELYLNNLERLKLIEIVINRRHVSHNPVFDGHATETESVTHFLNQFAHQTETSDSLSEFVIFTGLGRSFIQMCINE